MGLNGAIGEPRGLFGPLLKPGEVASGLGVSRSWLYQAAKDGRIPSIRLGGADGPLRFVEADLVDWVERARGLAARRLCTRHARANRRVSAGSITKRSRWWRRS